MVRQEVSLQNSAADGDSISPRARAQAIVADVLHRRGQGEIVPDEQVLAEHPELQQELRAELGVARAIRQAFLAARRAGPIASPLDSASGSDSGSSIDFGSSADFQAAVPAPPTIEGYWIVKEIGQGGQSVIYQAVQESTGRKVAVKLIGGRPLVSSRHRTRFDREAEILAALNHPNIVRIVDRGRTRDGSFFFSMDYIEGWALDDFWKEQLSPDRDGTRQLIAMFVKIAKAVDAAHRQGVVHRDLKPSNIRVDVRGEPQVLDFGLARLTDDLENVAAQTITRPGQIVGSLPWASPEQASGASSRVDARSDVYSLGAMLYQAITGRLAHSPDGTIDQVILRIRTAVPQLPTRSPGVRPGVNSALSAIILRALEKDPGKRHASAGELAEDLEAWLAGRRPAKLPRRFTRRRALLAGSGMLMACVGGGTWIWSRTPPRVVVFPLPSLTNSLDMRLVRIPPGEGLLGSPATEEDRDPHEHPFRARIAQPYYISVTEVTQAQYQKIMGTNPSAGGAQGADLPVNSVTWHEAVEFCQRLSEKENRRYRLPTEIEWEYACRAGDARAVAGTGKLDQMGWYQGNSADHLHAVGQKLPNRWGLYDMHGNVAEWCADADATDPLQLEVATPQSMRAARGGSALASAPQCRSAARQTFSPYARFADLGFRIALDPP